MALYNQYYSSADCTLSLFNKNGSEIQIDKLNGVMFSEELTSYPIYGLGNSKFGFVTQGNYLVTGFMDINFIHAAYMTNAINAINQAATEPKNTVVMNNISDAALSVDGAERIIDFSIEDLKTFKIQRDEKAKFLNKNGIVGQKLPFSIKIRLDNSSNLRDDNLASVFTIEDVKIIGSEMATSVNDESQIVRRYKFIARDLYEQSR